MKTQKIDEVRKLLRAAKKANLTDQETAWLKEKKFQIHGGTWHASINNPTDQDRAMSKQLHDKLNMHVIFINEISTT